MIEPYNAVGLVPTVWGISERSEIMRNIEHHGHMIKAASWLASLDLPVRLVALPEGALQGFNDEVLDLDHATFAETCAIDVPGPETEALGELCREYGVYLMAQAKARHADWPDRYFNVGFILDPAGELILVHYKTSPLFPVEHSVCPHDVYDWWIERHGRTLDAFWPVVDTPIGRLGIMMANEGSYPENARALAMNGAEVVYRASIPHPAASNDYFEIQNRARALDNNMYLVAPNMGTYYLTRDVGGTDRHVRRQLDDRRLPRPDRRRAALRRGVDVGLRAGQHRGAPPPPRHEPVDELDEGPAHRDVPDRLRSSRSTPRTSTWSAHRSATPSTRPRSPTARSALMHERDIWAKPST